MGCVFTKPSTGRSSSVGCTEKLDTGTDSQMYVYACPGMRTISVRLNVVAFGSGDTCDGVVKVQPITLGHAHMLAALVTKAMQSFRRMRSPVLA